MRVLCVFVAASVLVAVVATILPAAGTRSLASGCCKYCSGGSKACGDTCIEVNDHCHSPPGCACNGTSPPSPPPDPSYDHQTTAYHAKHKPLMIESADLEIAPFFSPDHSADTMVDFINKAKKTLDIITPSFSSWSHCTSGDDCIGCAVSTCSGEKFPVFPAILNAVHRGVAVRIITNNFNEPTCKGEITPFDFLALNGVKIAYFTSTTFDHTKFMMRDGKAASISSVNWSRSSYMKNREAGALVSGKDMGQVLKFLTSVYEDDWKQAVPYKVKNTYTAQQMAIITNKAHRSIDIPEGPQRPYISPEPKPIAVSAPFKLWTSPDYAYAALEDELNRVHKSFRLYIYQVTDMRLCNWLLDAYNRGIDITMLVSRDIYGYVDQQLANKCYTKLYNAGLKLHRTWQFGYYMYNHQKFWIIDGKRVGFSTGNWSPSDYPGGNGTYPPYGQPGWQSINRDLNVAIQDPAVVEVFDAVLSGDWKNSTAWYPH